MSTPSALHVPWQLPPSFGNSGREQPACVTCPTFRMPKTLGAGRGTQPDCAKPAAPWDETAQCGVAGAYAAAGEAVSR